MKLISRLHKYIHWVFITDNSFIRKKLSFFGWQIQFSKVINTATFFNSRFDIKAFPQAKGVYRKLQVANSILLEIFDIVCKKNNICYYLDYGTLIGAVRHKGFIPWDDDIDVTVPKEQIEKVINVFKSEFERTELYLYGDDNIRLGCNTLRITMRSFDSINLDIFYPYAFDINPDLDSEYARISKIWKEQKWEYLFTIWEIEKNVKKFNLHDFRCKTDKTFEDAVGNSCPLLSDKAKLMCLAISNQRPYLERKSDVFPLSTVIFEGREYPAPKYIDRYLRAIYGDYLSFPPTFGLHGDAFTRFLEEDVDLATKTLLNIKAELLAKYSTSV